MSRGKIKASCKNILIKAGMADEKLAHMLTQIDRFLDGKVNTGIQSLPKDIKEFVTRVKKEYEIEIRHRAHLEYLTLSREEQINARLDLFGTDLIEGLLSMFRGSNRIVKGARLSVDSINLGTLRDLIVGQSKDFEDADVLKIWASGKRDEDVIDAYYQFLREGKTSEDPVIKNIVEILHKWEKETISRLNSVGARIELEPGYLFRGSVDRVKLTDAKFQKWSDISMKYFDVKAMQKAKPADMEWIDYLESIYAEQATGRFKIANGAADSTVPSGFLAGNAQLARKTSAQAKMIFKDGQAHFAYIQNWGEKGFHAAQSVIFSMEHSSRNYALMEVLGPSPKRLVKKIIAERQAKLRSGEDKDIDKLIAQLQDTVDGMPRQLSDAFKEIDGTTRIPGNVTAASIGTGLRIAKNMALLGKIVLRSVTDFATIQSEARFQGIPFATALESHFISATALFKGSDAKEFGRLVHIGQEAVTSSLLDKFGIDQLGSGLGSQLQRYYFKLNGITYWNDALKSGFALMGATHLGNHAKFDWDELATHNYRVQRLLNIYDLDRHDWDVIRKTVYEFGKGNHSVLTPDRIEELPDEIIELLLTRKGLNPDDEALKRSFAEQLDETHAIVKEQRMVMQEEENIIQTNIAQRLKQLNRQPQLEAKFKKIKTEPQLKKAITELDKEITQLEEFLEKPYQGPREKEKSKRDILQDRELLKSLKEERTALSQVKVAEGKVKRDDIPTVGEVNKLNKQAGKVEEEITLIQAHKQKLHEQMNKLRGRTKNIEGELKQLSEEKPRLEKDIRALKAIEKRVALKETEQLPGGASKTKEIEFKSKIATAERRLETNKRLTKRLDRAKKLKDDIEDLDKQIKVKNKGLQEIKEFAASKKAEQRATVETQMREEFAFANVKKEVVSDEGFIGQTKLDFSTKRINRARADLAEKLNVLYQDRNNYAVLIPGARERAFFNRGTQPGTVLGEAVRFFAQFKTFPLAVYTKTLERDILAGGAQNIKQGLVEGMPFTAGNNGGDLVGIAGFMSAMTFYGSLGTMANDFFNGRTQRDWTDPKSIVDGAIAGGGFGLYSAAILESYSSTAHFQSASNAFGPVVGDIPDLLSLTVGAFNGEPKAQKFLDFLHGYTPLANVFYAKAVLDYLIFYNLQEAIDPGALLRMQQAVKKSSGQDFNIKPSDIVPHGGGIPSF
jgi:hypothetical protein